MSGIWLPILELSVVFPAAVLAFLPMQGHLRVRLRTLALLGVPVLSVWCVLAGSLCYLLHWPTNTMFPALLLLALAHWKLTDLPIWKTGSVFLGVCGVFSCTAGPATVLDALLSPGNTRIWYRPEAGAFCLLECCILLAVLWYPASHAARWLLDEVGPIQTWYVFWILPVIFVGLNVFLLPVDYATLYTGRMMQIYPVMSLAMLLLLLFCYLVFFLMARSLDANTRLQRENQFLQMQTAQYETLRTAIAETRQARHDLRHHYHILSALAEREEWEAIRAYLAEASGAVPAEELSLCDNPAADAVAGHYAALCRREEILFDCILDLPRDLPVAEMDFCVVLSNLLENALEAGRRTEPGRRRIGVRASLHGERLVLLNVENNYAGKIEEKNGVFQSTKRAGEGVGLQSVRRIAEKHGGYCRFSWEGGVFSADIMFRGEG